MPVSTSLITANSARRTSEVVEVGFLVELVEDGSRPELELGRSKDGDAVMWEFLREGGAAMMVLESGDPWCHYGWRLGTNNGHRHERRRTLSGSDDVRMGFVQWLTELVFRGRQQSSSTMLLLQHTRSTSEGGFWPRQRSQRW